MNFCVVFFAVEIGFYGAENSKKLFVFKMQMTLHVAVNEVFEFATLNRKSRKMLSKQDNKNPNLII